MVAKGQVEMISKSRDQFTVGGLVDGSHVTVVVTERSVGFVIDKRHDVEGWAGEASNSRDTLVPETSDDPGVSSLVLSATLL